MSSVTHIFFTGATGYIGGAVLTRLLEHPKAAQFQIHALIRNKDKAALIASKYPQVMPIIGANQDIEILEKAAAEADIVITAADINDQVAANAILRGLKKRYELTGRKSALIHTSGTGVVADNARGLFAGKDIYHDGDPEQIASIPSTQPHRTVDLAIEAADTAGYVNTYIVLPPTVYGIATGPLVDIGFQNNHSIQIPLLIKASIERGQGGVVGTGANYWPNVHIDELADLFIVIFNSLLSGIDEAPRGHAGYYFAENGEHRLYDVSAAVAQAMFDLGKGKDATPMVFSEEEMGEYFWAPWLGTNSRVVAERARALGWKPTKTTADFLASIKPEVEAILHRRDE